MAEEKEATELNVASMGNRSGLVRFRPFDLSAPVRIYHTNLPHWRQEGCTYFVTYRLFDSVPKPVLDQWEREKTDWIVSREIEIEKGSCWRDYWDKLSPLQQAEFLKLFNRRMNDYLDERRGCCALRDPRCSQIVLDGWNYYDGQRYLLGDLVVMPNHVHLLVTPFSGEDLERILQSRKRQSTRVINLITGRRGTLWQKHSFDHIVRTEDSLKWFQTYIEENPKKARLPKLAFRHRRYDWAAALCRQET